MQRSSRVPRCSAQRQTSLWTRLVAESDLNYFLLPRKSNSTFSRHWSDVSSSCCLKQRQPMLTISLARRSRAENRCLQVYTTRFWGWRVRRLVQITLCIKWRKMKKILSKQSSEISTWTTSSSQPERPKKRLNSTRKSERSLAKVDSTWWNG